MSSELIRNTTLCQKKKPIDRLTNKANGSKLLKQSRSPSPKQIVAINNIPNDVRELIF